MLPLEMLERIALQSIRSWKVMLAVVEFGLHSISLQRLAEERFTIVSIVPDYRHQTVTIKKHLDKKLHSTTSPSVILKTLDDLPLVLEEEWCIKGRNHRDNDLPAVLVYNEEGNVIQKEWYQNGVLHRTNDLPASVCYRDDGTVEKESWFRKGLCIRERSYKKS